MFFGKVGGRGGAILLREQVWLVSDGRGGFPFLVAGAESSGAALSSLLAALCPFHFLLTPYPFLLS